MIWNPTKDYAGAMTQHSHQTAPTQFVNTAGVRFAYRRFGKSTGVPLVFNMHFTGTMDHWDPLVTDGLAATREVILFNNAGISSSSGEVPSSAEEMAANAAAFIKALGLAKVDVLGFSLGGFVAQALAVAEPGLVRRLILVGTGPQGGHGMATLTPEAQAVFGAKYANPDEVWLGGFFTPTEASQAAGRAFLKRFRLRADNRDPDVDARVAPAQIGAMEKWGAPRTGAFDYLRKIAQPTLVINGSNDVIIYTVNSFTLQQNLPNAQLILYPDSNHGSQYQYPALFIADVTRFLDAEVPFPIQTARRLGNSDPKGINMAVQSENERNKAVVDEYFKAGVQGHLTSFAAYLHPDFTVTAPNYLPWGGRHVGAAFFRDHLLPGVTDVFDFARFSYDNVVAEDGHVVAVFNIGVTGTDAIIKIVDHWTLRDGKAISLWAAYFEPQAVLQKLGIKLTVDGGMNA
jgi:pimeloyl-ACP methyl ester carboxylesterase/ketosteroid isomerase-like protein